MAFELEITDTFACRPNGYRIKSEMQINVSYCEGILNKNLSSFNHTYISCFPAKINANFLNIGTN